MRGGVGRGGIRPEGQRAEEEEERFIQSQQREIVGEGSRVEEEEEGEEGRT
jgi:hypothetical protein